MAQALIQITARPEHGFDPAPLQAWMQAEVPQYGLLTAVAQIEGGQSNPTYRLHCTDGELVLRKQPPGPLLPSAHRIDREWKILAALGRSTPPPVPIPRAVAWCGDSELLGTPFYLTTWVAGMTVDTPLLPGCAGPVRRAAYLAYFRTLAAIHCVQPNAVGLADLGRAEGYVARQVARWSDQYDASTTCAVPAMTELRRTLAAWSPPDARPALVHGDYRFANLIFTMDGEQVRAVLDWELATIGHPLADLAFACIAFRCAPETPGFPGVYGLSPIETGVLTESEAIAAYQSAGGMARPTDWNLWMAYACFRLAAIAQGIYRRGTDGQASSARWRDFGPAVDALAAIGLESVR